MSRRSLDPWPRAELAVQAALRAVARTQRRRPGVALFSAALCAVLAVPVIVGAGGLTDGLTLDSDFRAMLPDEAASVRDMAEIERRFGGGQSLMVTVEADDEAGLHRFVRDLVPRIAALADHHVLAVDWNVGAFVDFVSAHRHLYAELADLSELRDVLLARRSYEREAVWDLGLLDRGDPPDPLAVLDRLRERAERARGRLDDYPGGFFQDPERTLVLLVVRTDLVGAEAEPTEALMAAIRAEAAALDPSAYATGVVVKLGGTLPEVLEETRSLVAAVRDAVLLTLGLVMTAILVFFRRPRAVPLLVLALVPPVLVTFALAEITVDSLNASTAFLSSIVVGNGINASVIWLARFMELRRRGLPLAEALDESHLGTWRATLTATAAAAVAYASLIVTDYRGFRDFGIIGGVGMVLCWLSAYLVLPALAVVWERWRPLPARPAASSNVYGSLFARVVRTAPRAILVASAASTVLAGCAVSWAVLHDPLEYDFRRLRSRRAPSGELQAVRRSSIRILTQAQTGSALAVLAPTRADVPRFVEQLERYERGVDPGAHGPSRTLSDLLPAEQRLKRPLLRELRELMLELGAWIGEEEWARIEGHLPPEDPPRLTVDDLPVTVARPFLERDGTRGRLLLLESSPEQNEWDGRYLVRWAAAARSLRAEGADDAPPVAGTAVVFADLSATVWRDGPRAAAVSLLATVLLVIMAFRQPRARLLTLVGLLAGVLWMAGTMALLGMRLNFLNFVAFPITFGNGVDYGVNVMRRFVQEEERGLDRHAAVLHAVRGTGGAVVLCSLTTVIGYLSLYTSSNQALNSFGTAMAISEVTCLAASVLVLPAVLWVGRNRPPREPVD
ncbi:MAG: RND family transporter [Sandaracinaceae bacterium]